MTARPHPVVARGTRPAARRTESGSALVEFAIVLLPLCIILFGIITYGVDLSFKQSMTQAADEAARAAATAPYADGNALAKDRARTATEDVMSGFGRSCTSPGMSCTFTVQPCGADTCMVVELDYDLAGHPLLPKFPFVDEALPSTVVARAVVQVNGSAA